MGVLMSPGDHRWSYGVLITDPLCIAFLIAMGAYFTDFAVGCCNLEMLYICSVAYGSYESLDKDRISDGSGTLEDCEFFDTADSEYFPSLVNRVDASDYRTHVRLNGNYFSFCRHDFHYGVIKVQEPIDPSAGPIQMTCWFQRVPDFGVMGIR